MNPRAFDNEDDGTRLTVSHCPDNDSHARLTTDDGEETVRACVSRDMLPAVTAAMHEAVGVPAPVILPRPQIPEDDSPLCYGNFVIRLEDSGVAIGLPGFYGKAIPPGAALELAAYIAAYAGQADAEPDPVEVEELAARIRSEIHPDSDRLGLRPSESDRIAARAALRWMRDREARDV